MAIIPHFAAPSAAPAPGAPSQGGVSEILREALVFYRRHARVLLITCAAVFLPAAAVKSIVVGALATPAIERFEGAADRLVPMAKSVQDALGQYEAVVGAEGEVDIRKLEKLEKVQADSLAALRTETDALKDSFARSLVGLVLRALVVMIVLALMLGVVTPAVSGALALMVADRATRDPVLDGVGLAPMSPGTAWRLVRRRFGALASALLLSSLFQLGGFALFVFPGIVFSVLFAFVAPVVLVEGLSGTAALKRSAALAGSDWIRVTLVLAALVVSTFGVQLLTDWILPTSFHQLGGFVGDLVTVVILPWPVLGTVLLYLDLRRSSGLADASLREGLAALRRVPGGARLD